MGDCGTRNRRQLLFLAKNRVGLNLGSFLIDQGQSHHDLQEWARNMGGRSGKMLKKSQGVRKVLVLLLKEQSIGST
jgi:hypothetical protein